MPILMWHYKTCVWIYPILQCLNISDCFHFKIQICEPEISKATEVDVQKLASWLNRTLPVVKEELDHVNRSQAFKEYISLVHTIDESTCSLLQSIDLSRNNSEQVIVKSKRLSLNKNI